MKKPETDTGRGGMRLEGAAGPVGASEMVAGHWSSSALWAFQWEHGC